MLRRSIAWIPTLLLIVCVGRGLRAEGVWQVGVAKAKITPKMPMPVTHQRIFRENSMLSRNYCLDNLPYELAVKAGYAFASFQRLSARLKSTRNQTLLSASTGCGFYFRKEPTMFSRIVRVPLFLLTACALTSLAHGQSASFQELAQKVNGTSATQYVVGDTLYAQARISFTAPSANPLLVWDYELRLEIRDSDDSTLLMAGFVSGQIASGQTISDIVQASAVCGNAQAYDVVVLAIAKEQGLIGPANDWLGGGFNNSFVNQNP